LNIVRNNNYEISSKQKKRKEKQISSIEKEWGIRYPVSRSLQKRKKKFTFFLPERENWEKERNMKKFIVMEYACPK
jgi:hypothetical protein